MEELDSADNPEEDELSHGFAEASSGGDETKEGPSGGFLDDHAREVLLRKNLTSAQDVRMTESLDEAQLAWKELLKVFGRQSVMFDDSHCQRLLVDRLSQNAHRF